VLADALEQLVDERIAYERKPSAEQYREFKRIAMGVDMQDGGWHHSDRTLSNRKAQQIASGTQGNLPDAYLLVETPDGAVLREVALAGEALIGRSRANDVALPGNVSKRHARIVGRQGKYLVIDLKSTNSTYVNGNRVDEPHVLQPGDIIYIGDWSLRYGERKKPDNG
jgi:hypothetical protein